MYLCMWMYEYIFMYMHVCVCTYIYLYIYRERDLHQHVCAFRHIILKSLCDGCTKSSYLAWSSSEWFQANEHMEVRLWSYFSPRAAVHDWYTDAKRTGSLHSKNQKQQENPRIPLTQLSLLLSRHCLRRTRQYLASSMSVTLYDIVI
jgi:hypothetical protein